MRKLNLVLSLFCAYFVCDSFAAAIVVVIVVATAAAVVAVAVAAADDSACNHEVPLSETCN